MVSFEVTATNAKGSSARSTWPGNCAAGAGTASTAVTEAACIATEGSVWYDAYDPHGGVAPGAVPGAPTVSSVVSHPDGDATIVSFEPPMDDGGHTVHTYTVRAYQETGVDTLTLDAQTEDGCLSPITVPGTVDGTEYFFTVTADNTVADVNTGASAALRRCSDSIQGADAPRVCTVSVGTRK